MLYLLGARSNPMIRLVLGLAMLAAGLLLHTALLIALSAVFVIWGGVAVSGKLRERRQSR